MPQTNSTFGLGSGRNWLARMVAQEVDQPAQGTPTDSQYTEGQTPADLDAAELSAREDAEDA